jgi:hypothetical protein
VKVFINSNIPMYFAGREHPNRPPSERFFAAVERKEVEACTSAEVLQEILYRYSALHRFDLARQVYDLFVIACPVGNKLGGNEGKAITPHLKIARESLPKRHKAGGRGEVPPRSRRAAGEAVIARWLKKSRAAREGRPIYNCTRCEPCPCERNQSRRTFVPRTSSGRSGRSGTV